jgi:amino acid adenylation domain-containing protein
MHQSNGTPPQLSILNHPPQIQQGPDLLHNLVRSSSDALAIDFLEHGTKRRKFSYKTLHALSDALASKITKRLAKLESASPIIPVFLPQCPELYLVLLAVLKAGKAFCPLSPDTPVERLRFIIEDVSADFVITLSSFIERIRTASDIPTVLVDHELTERGDELNIQLPRTRSDDLAYVLYTSGSTGLPKAVSVSHRAVTQSLLGHDRHLPQFSRFLQFAAPTFDVSIFEIFFPWFRGRTLVGCTRAQMLDDLSGTIRKLEADAAELTPTVVSNLLHGRSSVPGLRLLLTIGEMLNRHVVDEYGGSDGSKSMLWAMYGPTEAAIHCTLQVNCASSASTGTIGSPMGAVSTFIISPASADNVPAIIEILPIGEVGELALGGPQIAEEYLNRPELTSASFIQHPDYGRLYRTGDRARQHENGTLECLGRVVAGQIKLRGQRVELGEVEQIISKIDSCRATVVMVIDDNLVAFCATSTSRVLRSDVIQICKEWLPVFMVPSDVYFLDNMPQLPSGKIDRESLKARYLLATQSNGNSFVDANDEVGQSVLRVFQQHLTRNLTLGTNLAAVGLDSLQSIRIASALRQEGYGLGAMDVLSAETLEELVKTYKDRSVLNGHPTLSDSVESALSQADLKQYQLSRDDIFGCTPCTPLQEAMLAETVARPSAYCNWIEIELLSSYTHKQIIAALQNLVDSNEILRTGFCPASRNAETFTQIIWKNLLPSQIRTVEQFSRAFTLADTEALLRPLNIQISRTSGRPRLLFQIHHALYDGWSMDLMLYDLHKILRGEVIAPRPQFRDISQYLTRDLQRDDREDAHEYWTKFLLEYVPMVLPNFNGKAVLYKGTQIWSGRSVVDHRLLYERAQKLAINPQVFFQAATAYVLSLYSGSTDVVIGNVTSGRTIPVTRVEEIIGPCITSLPFRLNFKDHTLVRDVLHQTQLVNRESLRHCVLPMRDIAKLAKVQPGARLFDLLFVWQQSLQPTSALDAKIIESADDLEFQVTLEYEPRKDYVSFRATFDSSTIPEHQIKYLSRQIDEVVLLFLKDVNCKVTDIVKGFTNGTLSVANPKPDEPRIRQGPSYAVERWASEDPNRLAIVFGHLLDGAMIIKDSMTYGTLNSRANQLARVLAQHGIGQDQLIGVIMEKSVKLYVSILAILKLGCGYLPLVPETPLERIKTIMDDAQVKICISETSVSARLRGDLSIRILESDVIELQDYCDGNLDRPYYGHHLAYAVFTSGSTGTPKGVLVTQNNLMSNLEYLSTIYPYSVNSRLLQSCSQAFDVSVFEIFFSWHVGICLCTARKDDLFYDFEAAINSLQITHLSLTPTVAALVQPKNVPKVEFIVTAGEAVTEIVRRNWAGRGLYQGQHCDFFYSTCKFD